MQMSEVAQAGQTKKNESARMCDLKSAGTAAAAFVSSPMPLMLGTSEASTNSLSFDGGPLLYAPQPNYMPLFTSPDSAGHFYPSQSGNQSALYQSALTSPPTTIFQGGISQPFVGAGSNQPLYATANQPTNMFTSVTQPFNTTANPHDMTAPFAAQHNHAAYGPYSASLHVDGNHIFTAYDPSAYNGTVSHFGDTSLNFIGEQLAKTGLSDDAAFPNGQHNGVCGQFGSLDEPVANYGGYASDPRRRRVAAAVANGNGSEYTRNRRFPGYRPPGSFGADRSRLRQAETVGSRGFGRPGGPGGSIATQCKRQQAAVFSESDFPSLNDALRSAPKANGKSNVKEEKQVSDENANERRPQSSEDSSEQSAPESEEGPLQPVRPASQPDTTVDNDIDRTVQQLVERLRPLLVSRGTRPFDDFLPPPNARFFIVKSNSEDDVYRSLKYSIWCSTPHGNSRLQRAFTEQLAHARVACHTSDECAALDAALRDFPVLLFFSVNGSGHFCGVARMRSPVDPAARSRVWVSERFTGRFDVDWLYVKDVPNAALRHIRVDPSEPPSAEPFSPFALGHKVAFTHQRDCTEIGRREALEALRVVHEYQSQTTIFDDARFYEERERSTSHLHSRPHSHPEPDADPVQSDSRATYSGLANGLRSNANGTEVPPSVASHHTEDSSSKISYAKVVNGPSSQPRNYANAVLAGTPNSSKPEDSASSCK